MIGILHQQTDAKLDLKVSLDDVPASAQIFSATETALNNVEGFAVEMIVVHRSDQRERRYEHREVGHYGRPQHGLTFAHGLTSEFWYSRSTRTREKRRHRISGFNADQGGNSRVTEGGGRSFDRLKSSF